VDVLQKNKIGDGIQQGRNQTGLPFDFHPGLLALRNVENKPIQIQKGPVLTGDTAALFIDPALTSVPV